MEANLKDEDTSIKPICQIQRQSFIDCMYVYDLCVQSGQKSFQNCFKEIISKERSFPKPCLKLYKDFLTCRRQMVTLIN